MQHPYFLNGETVSEGGLAYREPLYKLTKGTPSRLTTINRYRFWVGEVQNAATCSGQTWGWGKSCSPTGPLDQEPLCRGQTACLCVAGGAGGRGEDLDVPKVHNRIMLSAQVSHLQGSTGSLPCTGGLPTRWQDRRKGVLRSHLEKGLAPNLNCLGPFPLNLFLVDKEQLCRGAFSLLESMGSGSHPSAFLSPA